MSFSNKPHWSYQRRVYLLGKRLAFWQAHSYSHICCVKLLSVLTEVSPPGGNGLLLFKFLVVTKFSGDLYCAGWIKNGLKRLLSHLKTCILQSYLFDIMSLDPADDSLFIKKTTNSKTALFLCLICAVFSFPAGRALDKRVLSVHDQGWQNFHGRCDLWKRGLPCRCDPRSHQVEWIVLGEQQKSEGAALKRSFKRHLFCLLHSTFRKLPFFSFLFSKL